MPSGLCPLVVSAISGAAQGICTHAARPLAQICAEELLVLPLPLHLPPSRPPRPSHLSVGQAARPSKGGQNSEAPIRLPLFACPVLILVTLSLTGYGSCPGSQAAWHATQPQAVTTPRDDRSALNTLQPRLCITQLHSSQLWIDHLHSPALLQHDCIGPDSRNTLCACAVWLACLLRVYSP